ncbi:MAG: linear amide C-N hydrolase [Pseudomonadales bacterium]
MRFVTLLLFTLTLILSAHTQGCTKLVWATDEFGVFIARSEDFDFHTKPMLEVRARGQHYVSPGEGTQNAEWTSKYSSLMITLLDITSVEGFNEKGLSVSALSLDEDSDEAPTPGEEVELNNVMIVPYVLDNFATVKEAVAGLESLRIVRGDLSDTLKAEGHYAIQDNTGDSAIIEIVAGKFKAYHDKKYNVVTNSPTYDQHLSAWEQLKPSKPSEFVGSFPIPGNTSSADRFIRGKYMLEALPQPSSHINGILKVNSALPVVPVSIVGRVVDGQAFTSATQYTATYNLGEQVLYIRYQYEDVFTQYHVNFKTLNDGKNYLLDATNPTLAGDVTARFTEGNRVMQRYVGR